MQPLAAALEARLPLLAEPHDSALRLFNGFIEGLPGLVAEVYARTLVVLDHGLEPGLARRAADFYRERLPWLESGLLKLRASPDPDDRLGLVIFGLRLARRVRENGVSYALDLRLNQDTSFYLDARGLRAWLKRQAPGLSVLNTFAYTGSLGAACAAGGAARVLQSDLNRRFLNLGKDTFALNGLPVRRADFLPEDFFRLSARLRRAGEIFDLVVLDPPFFSATPAGRVDLVGETVALVNKVRPLVRDGGRLVVVNNALFVSGRDFLGGLEDLGGGGKYLELEEIIPVPPDAAGMHPAAQPAAHADPAPFNHTTKIAVLRLHRAPRVEDQANCDKKYDKF